MKKTFIPNKRAHESEKDFYRDQALKAHNEKVKRQKERYEKDHAHYSGLLSDMVNHAVSQINSDSTLEHIQEVFGAGEAGWKIICSRVRQTNSVLTLKVDSFKNALIEALEHVYESALNPKVDENNTNERAE